VSFDTRLDKTHAAMQADLSDDTARMHFYQALADAELFLLLAHDGGDEQIAPELLEMDGDRYALVFDGDERLSRFTEEHLPGTAAPYAALPGRAVAQMLRGQKIGLGLNLGVAPSSILIPAEALDWLASTLDELPEEIERPIVGISAPVCLPEGIHPALAAKLAPAGGVAAAAALATARYGDGSTGLIVGFTAPLPGTEQALAHAVQEALVFSGIADLTLEVGFFAPNSAEAKSLAASGLAIPLPPPDMIEAPAARPAPGSNPDTPPKLR
jgi:hypothetical protein